MNLQSKLISFNSKNQIMQLVAILAVVMVSLARQTLTFPVDASAQPAGVDCTALANAGDCDFYTQCVEAKFQCGPRGYPLGYGDKYCRRFEDNMDCFNSPYGKDWVNDARVCHMKAILNSVQYNSNTTTCDELQAFAFESQPSCYVNGGFCSDILPSDTNLQCLELVFDVSDSFGKLAIQQVYDTAVICPKQSINIFLSSVQNSIMNAVTATYRQLLETLENLLGGCNSSGLDVVFIMDASGSIGNSKFDMMKNFVFSTIFEIRQDTRVGVVQFGREADIVVPLDVLSAYNGYQNDGCTNTHKALELMSAAFKDARTTEGVPRVAIVITDGQSCDKALTAETARAVHDSGITVFSFGIGDIDPDDLIAMASTPSNMFHIPSFSAGDFASQLIPLRTKVCTTPAIIASTNEPLQGTISRNTRRLLKYILPEEGLTLKLTGDLLVYGSFTVSNPTPLTADFSVESDGEGIEYFVSLPTSFSGESSGDGSIRQHVYLSVEGKKERNHFVLETSLGDTTIKATIEK